MHLTSHTVTLSSLHVVIVILLPSIGVVGIGQDITGRIAQEREYTRLIDTANAPIFVSDSILGFL